MCPRRLGFIPLLSLLALFAACSDDEPPPTAAAPSITQTLVVPPAATPAPGVNLPVAASQAWLIDARTGARTTLLDSVQDTILEGRFAGDDAVQVLTRPRTGDSQPVESHVLRLDGSVVSRGPLESPCRDAAGGVEVGGRVYRDVACGPISPDNRWMTYQVVTGERELPGGYRIPVWDQWAVNLQTDERRLLQEGLDHCGGCDGRFGPVWSPSGRYVFYSEWIQSGSIFLSDLQTGATREIFAGNTETSSRPVWSPAGDQLAYRASNDQTILEDLDRGIRTELALAWPARFDPSGTQLYGPAFQLPGNSVPNTLQVYTASSAASVTIAGVPAPGSWRIDFVPVQAQGDSFIAALEGVPGCDGTTIYTDGTPLTCVQGGRGASVSPDGSGVAMLRHTGETQRLWTNSQAQSFATYDVVLVDVSTGAERVLVSEVLGETMSPGALLWHPSGRYLLINQPFLVFGP